MPKTTNDINWDDSEDDELWYSQEKYDDVKIEFEHKGISETNEIRDKEMDEDLDQLQKEIIEIFIARDGDSCVPVIDSVFSKFKSQSSPDEVDFKPPTSLSHSKSGHDASIDLCKCKGKCICNKPRLR